MSTINKMPTLKNKNTYKKEKLINLPGVAGKVKKFDSKLHQKYDERAREIIKYRFPDHATDNPNIYGEDLIFNHDILPYKFIEVQVCSTWDDDRYPYPYPFVYARKMRFSNDTLFVTFDRTYTKVIIFSKKVIDEKPVRLKKYDREMVHMVSWGRALKMDTADFTLENLMGYAGVSQ